MSAGGNEGIVGHHIRLAAFAMHLIEQLEGQFPFPGFFTGADEAGIGDDITLAAACNHILAAAAQNQC